ncbi:restriction endonuclease subunit S [Aliarcobacter cryaerophilus]|uniref:Type I restriction modification DNA specificity domain-containing protein n=1 Tax=Aliarcobacter cryaerophilus TaxID=28198 RepID=A0A2S9TGI0_9BACT|nr:restriction endonuclease subunit S [Aliarcobacter cryaerophilus]PRM97938.1 hypothetical protein CJ670_04535 [Arcobacter cryaerophilus gv. crypticus]
MNQIKQGYKQTKVGIIPEDWEVVKLRKLVEINSGESPSEQTFESFGVPYFKVEQLNTSTKYQFETPYFIKNPKKVIKSGSIIFPKRGASILLNKIRILKFDSFMDTNLMTITINKANCNNEYLYYFILRTDLSKIADTTSIPQINNKHIEPYLIPLPPLKEQERIAEILTTWDEAITKQTELLRAKELQKKALMQKLLSGEVRFSGFSDEWEEIRLGKYIKEISKKNKENVELVLSVTNKHGFIAQKDYFEKEVASKDTSNYKIVKKGNFAYNPSRINVGSLGLLEEYEIGILSPMYVIFECLKGLDKQYLNYWLNTHNFTGNLSKFLSGSVRDSLAFNDMKLMKIKLPSLPEQQKIAEVLSLADDEINLLKKELDELKQQKKALMQKLLTGEVRVKV